MLFDIYMVIIIPNPLVPSAPFDEQKVVAYYNAYTGPPGHVLNHSDF